MYTRELRLARTLKEAEDYTYNLKLHLDAKRSTLDTVLRVSMPHQLANMRTIMWINLLLIGFSLHISGIYGQGVWLYAFWLFAALAVMLIVAAMLQRRIKYYGCIEDDDFMADKIDYRSPYARAEAISVLINMASGAIGENTKIMGYLAKWMHMALWASLAGLISFVIYCGLAIHQKEHTVAKEKPKPSSVKPITPPQRPMPESEERGYRPQADKPTPKPKSG